jgi:hypothetical protein
VGSCECGDESSGSGTMELVSNRCHQNIYISQFTTMMTNCSNADICMLATYGVTFKKPVFLIMKHDLHGQYRAVHTAHKGVNTF